MDRLTRCVGTVNGKNVYSSNIDMRKIGSKQKLIDKLAHYEDLEEQRRLVELPEKWLEILKLLTISAICYQKWHDIIISKLKDSKDIQQLFFNLPTVQYTHNHIKLIRLKESGLDVNALTNIGAIVDIMYPREEAQKALSDINSHEDMEGLK